MKAWFGGAAAVALALVAPGVVAAAPKNMCPGGRSGWERNTIDAIAAEVWDGLIDQSPWEDVAAFTAYVDAAVDHNDDDVACLTTRWGTQPAEPAHWYGVPLFLVVDNTANG